MKNDAVRNNIVRNVKTYKDLVKRGLKNDADQVLKFLERMCYVYDITIAEAMKLKPVKIPKVKVTQEQRLNMMAAKRGM